MDLIRSLGRCIPRLRQLHEARDALLDERQRLAKECDVLRSQITARAAESPFFHYNDTFDPVSVLYKHAMPNLKPRPGYLTNFLGVLIDPKFFPDILEGRAGEVEPVPIPANWHADIAEWGAALRAVDLARNSFTVIELGCGWGCWLNNTGVAARRAGLDVQLIGVEGNQGHIRFAEEAIAVNGFSSSQRTLYHGIAAAMSGTALFPRQLKAGANWGLKPILNATEEQKQEALASGNFDEQRMIALLDVTEPYSRIDLLHLDIQGGETGLIADSLDLLRNKVAYMLIATHSRQIEGELFRMLQAHGWRLEIERPAILNLHDPAAPSTVDGVQGWRNPILLP